MTPAAALLEPDSNPALYINSVLILYVDLPDTLLSANTPEQERARSWFDRGVSLLLFKTALFLASLRRMTRPLGVPPCRASDH